MKKKKKKKFEGNIKYFLIIYNEILQLNNTNIYLFDNIVKEFKNIFKVTKRQYFSLKSIKLNA